MKLKLLFFALLCHLIVNGQNKVLSFEEYLAAVRKYHPVAQQAEILIDQADAQLTGARGSLDPKLYLDYGNKNFNETEYYKQTDAGIKIPTWLGIDVVGGFVQNYGTYLNPESKTPNAGLAYAGLSVPVGQGLFIDARRVAIKKAQIYQNLSMAERTLVYNELLYEAGLAYWDWHMHYNNLLVYTDALAAANQRLEAVKQSVIFGDRPAIDTLEAGIQVQDRKLMLQQANLDFENATAYLNVFLWAAGNVPLRLEAGTAPVVLDATTTTLPNTLWLAKFDSLVANHPELQQSRFKIDQLEIDKRWRLEQLKPALDLKYNAITQPVGNGVLAEFNANNYVVGVNFSMPLFLRKERGALQYTNLQIQDAALGLNNKTANLAYKATATLNKWNTSKQQADLYSNTVRDYGNLLAAERRLFSGGESSLFLVNAREMSYISSQIKLNDLLAKNKKASIEAGFVLGILYTEF